MDNVNRRKHVRVETNNLIAHETIGKDGKVVSRSMGKALNVSQSGIFLETPQMILSEFISMMSVDYNNNLVEIVGEVIYSTFYKNSTFGSGIRFKGMRTENIRFVTKLIKVFNIRKYELAAAVGL